ncbi:MAG: hypothetical protein GXP16_04780 [Gammaproteobacteria bacterium]|nr:hypothetical protein [Gammaproteobacteria bacterium]
MPTDVPQQFSPSDKPEPGGLNKSRRQMIAIVIISLLSLGGAYLLFYVTQTGGGWGTTNKGEFVDPPVNIVDIGWEAYGQVSALWWVWVVTDECAATCQKTTKNMRAVHILLNRDSDRVRRGFTELNIGSSTQWLTQYPKMVQIKISKPVKSGVYIIDPNGNLVLYYEMATDPSAVLDDLKKLLKVSQIG